MVTPSFLPQIRFKFTGLISSMLLNSLKIVLLVWILFIVTPNTSVVLGLRFVSATIFFSSSVASSALSWFSSCPDFTASSLASPDIVRLAFSDFLSFCLRSSRHCEQVFFLPFLWAWTPWLFVEKCGKLRETSQSKVQLSSGGNDTFLAVRSKGLTKQFTTHLL